MSELALHDLEQLYARYGANVLHRCQRLLGDDELGWDAMHEVFVRAIKHRGTFRGDAKPLTWLFSIAFRVCMDLLRAKKKAGEGELDDVASELAAVSLERSAGSFAERFEQQSTVAKLLTYFDRESQAVVIARYFDELEVADIARQLSLSERTVARRLGTFLERSQRILAEARV